MKTKTIKYYTIDELKEKFPEIYTKVLEKHRYINVDHNDWWTDEIEYWKIRLSHVGFENAMIWFSGFGSQGDGACFDADCNNNKLIDYVIKNNLVKQIVEVEESGYTPKRVENWRIGQLKKLAERLLLTIDNRNIRYSHEYSRCLVYNIEGLTTQHLRIERAVRLLVETVEQLRIDLSCEIYKALEKLYDILLSDETIHEILRADGRYFDESGRLE